MRRTVPPFGIATLALAAWAGPIAAQESGTPRDSAAAPNADSAGERTTSHGVYSEAQAGRGEDVMFDTCAECHVEGDFGGAFLQAWSGATVQDLMDELLGTMPEDNPGGLPRRQYVDVIAFMFMINGLPAGEEDMGETDDELEAIRIEYPPPKE